jgi:putative flippase GtrA
MLLHERMDKYTSPEVVTFLAVGGLGYVVDVASFNLLRSAPVLSTVDPSYARVVAVALAMVITYYGNRFLTWRGQSSGDRRREIGLFIVFNVIGLGPSLVALVISHDLLGMTSRLADNISANVVGLALGTLFRYWSYRRFVFTRERPNHERGYQHNDQPRLPVRRATLGVMAHPRRGSGLQGQAHRGEPAFATVASDPRASL